MSNLPQEDYDYAEVIGRNLQRLINERGTTQAAIAQKLGIARSGINKYVQGVSSPSPRNIVRISRALGVTADELLRVDSALPQDGEWNPRDYIADNVDKLTDVQADNIADTMREYITLGKARKLFIDNVYVHPTALAAYCDAADAGRGLESNLHAHRQHGADDQAVAYIPLRPMAVCAGTGTRRYCPVPRRLADILQAAHRPPGRCGIHP